MGCVSSSLNRIEIEYIFNSNDIFYLTQSWNIIKTHDLRKFSQDVLIRTINLSPSFRQYWTSKIQVEGNNYDFSQSESCLRTDLSWHIGLRDYSIQFISIFDQILAVINNENKFLRQIQSIIIPENNFLIEDESLLIIKQSIMEILREQFKKFNYDFIDEYDKVWNKFLTFIIEYMIKQKNTIRTPKEKMIFSAINKE